MSIKLTKKIGDKVVELDLISLDGKSIVRDNVVKELQKKGITKQDLEEAGFSIKESAEAEPDMGWTREELNNYAEGLGIENPDKLKNKGKVLEAIKKV
jgi:hypothetical protein